MSSQFWGLIDSYLRRHATREAALARKMGIKGARFNQWKLRGLKTPLPAETVHAVADGIEVPYEEVLTALLIDTGYLQSGDTVLLARGETLSESSVRTFKDERPEREAAG